MKIITCHNTTKFSKECLNNLRKTANVITPIREIVSYGGADYELRVNSIAQAIILSIKITNPNQFISSYFMASRIESVIKEQIESISEHFGKPEQVEIEIDSLKMLISTPTKNPKDAKIINAEVMDLAEVLKGLPSMVILGVKEEAMEKAKEYFERQQ